MKKYKFNKMLIQITNNTKNAKPAKPTKAKTAKGMDAWGKVSHSKKYRKAVAKDLCQGVAAEVIDECLDGVCLNLSEGNSMRSGAAQKRILRRIVEKRQAQANHRKLGRTSNLLAAYLEKACCSNSLTEINLYRFCA